MLKYVGTAFKMELFQNLYFLRKKSIFYRLMKRLKKKVYFKYFLSKKLPEKQQIKKIILLFENRAII